MKKLILALGLLGGMALGLPSRASAGFALSFGLPGFGLVLGDSCHHRAYLPPPPVAYYPPPVAYAPPPVVYAPPVVGFGFRSGGWGWGGGRGHEWREWHGDRGHGWYRHGHHDHD